MVKFDYDHAAARLLRGHWGPQARVVALRGRGKY